MAGASSLGNDYPGEHSRQTRADPRPGSFHAGWFSSPSLAGTKADLFGEEGKGGMRLIRVFPRKTRASPDDSLAYFGPPDLFAEADEIHISVSFTADKMIAERLAEEWRHVAPVKIGGYAYDDPGDEFTPGRYIKHGYTFTSRGCPRRCWFCGVWKRKPQAAPLKTVHPGWDVLDDNLLACPESHVRAVFKMLANQGRRIQFTGGLEALALEDYQVGLLADMKPRPNCFFAYDPGDPFETLKSAADRMLAAGFTARSHRLRCYVLIGYPRDTFAAAEVRLQSMVDIGFTPHAMLWQPDTPSAERYRPGPDWKRLQRKWARPAIIHGSLPASPVVAVVALPVDPPLFRVFS